MYAVFHTVAQNLLGVDSECNAFFCYISSRNNLRIVKYRISLEANILVCILF